MKIFGEVNVLRGSIAWTRPFHVRLTHPEPILAAPPTAAPAVPEYDEEGRLYVFRFAWSAPTAYRIERDRLFEYMKRRRLPDEGQRQIRRDVRNRADFFSDVRELQTPNDLL